MIKREEGMPKTKNQGKNKSRFEVRGGLLNEYEFALNEGAMAEEERNRLAQMEEERSQREGEEGVAVAAMSPQEREAARIREVMETAHEKAQRNIEKRERREGKGAQKSSRKGARKRASKAGAGKKAAGKKRSGAGSAKKGGARKSGATKAAKKSAAKKSAKKRAVAGSARTAGRSSARKGAAKKASTKKAARRAPRK
jgi:hypothetical protein